MEVLMIAVVAIIGAIWLIVEMKNITVDPYEIDELGQSRELWYSKAEADLKYQWEKRREEEAFPLLLGIRYMDQNKKKTIKITFDYKTLKYKTTKINE